jgi:hypothetical protein
VQRGFHNVSHSVSKIFKFKRPDYMAGAQLWQESQS